MSSRNAWSDRLSPSNRRGNPNQESPLSNTSPAAAAEKTNNKIGNRRTDERRRNRRSSLRSLSCSSAGRWKYMAGNLGGMAFKCSGQPEAIAKWNSAEDSERAINQPPANRFLANGAANQRQRNDERARDKTRTQDPYVSQRVNERPDEENGNDDVRKRQPVRAVGKPRTDGVTLPKTVSDGENPSIKTAVNLRRRDSVKAADRRDLLKLTLERECGDAAQNKSEHEQAKHPAEPAECGIGLGFHGFIFVFTPWPASW